MNKSAVKVQEKSGTDLMHDEVDGHLLARKTIEDFGIGGERPSLGILETLGGATAGKVSFGL